ncbi:MAG: hypothetical protein BIFFINMI_03399 [Phycisphaerae bacterium]|nr:hypothetical protein [Phycisphaerae bacterium]
MSQAVEKQTAHLNELVEAIVASYDADERTQHLDSEFLPNRDEVIELIGELRELLFPGFFTKQKLTGENVRFHVGELLTSIQAKLQWQTYRSLRYRRRSDQAGGPDDHARTEARAAEIVRQFLARIPAIRTMLAGDVQALYDGDPAAKNLDEVVFAYPGLVAISTYRVAHELLLLGAPLLARIMTEWAHSVTGIDIHPGATIGQSFFIDHGTGVVIGETTHIGNNVKLYQGVTLGALSFPKDERGNLIRGQKRHPTIEDDVTIYANATILGGSTFIGRGCIIGGNVFLTKSVPPNTQVQLKSPDLKVKERRDLPAAAPGATDPQ